MASNYTTNYQLPLWQPEDDFVRAEFNDTNEKVDAALAAANAERIHVGSYTGDGADTRTIPLPFTPTVVIVSGQRKVGSVVYSLLSVAFGQFCHQLYDDNNSASGNVAIVEGGFQVKAGYHNDSGFPQRYIAFR